MKLVVEIDEEDNKKRSFLTDQGDLVDVPEDLGQWIKQNRERMTLSRDELGGILSGYGGRRQLVTNWESNKGVPSAQFLIRLYQLFVEGRVNFSPMHLRLGNGVLDAPAIQEDTLTLPLFKDDAA